jgi:C1A family cysteine protease
VNPAYDVRKDWADCVTEAYTSGNCSSSYAIASATALSSRYCIGDMTKYQSLRLSPQQILSCDKKSRGCKGGGVDSVFSYIQRRGLYPEECVPFANGENAACKTDCGEDRKHKALDHCLVSSERAIKREIAANGPVVAPLMLRDDYLVYEGGVYTPTDHSRQLYGADGEAIMHAVPIFGWGKSQGQKYWIVQESWGNNWGEKGFSRVAINSIVRESYGIAVTAATEEAYEEQKKAEERAAKRKEELLKERALRDERIAERARQREVEEKAAKEAAEDAELDDIDFDDDEEEKPAADKGDHDEM